MTRRAWKMWYHFLIAIMHIGATSPEGVARWHKHSDEFERLLKEYRAERGDGE